MSLAQKVAAMNVATKNLTVEQLAKEMGVSKTRMHIRLISPSYLHKFLEYCEFFGFQLVVRNEQGTIIPFTYQDALDDLKARQDKRDEKATKKQSGV